MLSLRRLLVLLSSVFVSLTAFSWTMWTPGDTVDDSAQHMFSKGYKPEQPLPFSHKIHATDRKINCEYCHSSARRSITAGVPSMNTCMGCHKVVQSDAEPIKKLKAMYDANEPLKWTKVHDLPDYVRFSHKVHANAKDPHGKKLLECQTCHGPVEKGDVAEQWAPLQMGWCIDCHNKELKPATKETPAVKYARVSCNTCHY